MTPDLISSILDQSYATVEFEVPISPDSSAASVHKTDLFDPSKFVSLVLQECATLFADPSEQITGRDAAMRIMNHFGSQTAPIKSNVLQMVNFLKYVASFVQQCEQQPQVYCPGIANLGQQATTLLDQIL